ncbi:tetratricopeptide repeat protein, partial [Streptomyces sp. NPDC097640]|uniref:tetratricopeptide repeat protein n=1 Tax=Streptomyces sp. NPDC097640 TaxID=3157229 RepID=UPI00333058AF
TPSHQVALIPTAEPVVSKTTALPALLHPARNTLVFAQTALDIALGLRNLRLEGFWLLTLGAAQQVKGQFSEALISYQRSATLHRRLADRSREALAWQGVGEVYRRLGRHAEAADFYRQAASTHRDLGDEWHQALALDGLGSAVLDENSEEARRHWAQALRLLTDFGDSRAVAARENIERRLTETS